MPPAGYGATEPSDMPEMPAQDYNPKTTLARASSIGALNSAKESSPMANAYMNQEKAIAELEMNIELLERKLDPISTRYDDEGKAMTEDPEPPTSEIVRAYKQNTHKIYRLSMKVRRMTQELEV